MHWAGRKPWDDKNLPLANKWWDYLKQHTNYQSYFEKRYRKLNTQKNYKYRIHIGNFDIFSIREKDNKSIYRILGIKLTVNNPAK